MTPAWLTAAAPPASRAVSPPRRRRSARGRRSPAPRRAWAGRAARPRRGVELRPAGAYFVKAQPVPVPGGLLARGRAVSSAAPKGRAVSARAVERARIHGATRRAGRRRAARPEAGPSVLRGRSVLPRQSRFPPGNSGSPCRIRYSVLISPAEVGEALGKERLGGLAHAAAVLRIGVEAARVRAPSADCARPSRRPACGRRRDSPARFRAGLWRSSPSCSASCMR